MTIPILSHGQVLVASLQSAATDAELVGLRDALAAKIGYQRSRGVVIDVTGLDVIDSFASRMLREIAQTTKLRGAETVVVGIQPEVAFAMVQLGLAFDGIATGLDFEEGLDLLAARMRPDASS